MWSWDFIAIDRDRVFTYNFLLRHERNSFLKKLVTRNETWIKICIENVLDLRTIDLQLSRSLNFTRRKFFLSIWWDWKDIVYYKLFSQGNETINFGKYCNQLDKLKHTIAGKRSKLVNRQGHYNKTACCIDCKRKAVTI